MVNPEGHPKQYATSSWSHLSAVSNAGDPNVPLNRAKHASCQYGDYMYVFGGKDGRVNRKDLWRYHTIELQWEKIKCSGEPPTSPQEITMVAYKAKLFVFGGEFQFGGKLDCPLWIFHLETFTWERHEIDSEVLTPVNRRGHSAVICNSAMYVYGGFVDLKGSSAELWTLDLESMSWHLAHAGGGHDEGPGGRHDHSAIMYDGCMYVYGGMSGLHPKDDLWKWSFSGRAWCRVKHGKGPPPLKAHSACRVADIMLIYGGIHNGMQHGDLWAFNFKSYSWSKFSPNGPSPLPRSHHSAVVLAGSALDSASDRTQSVPYLRNVDFVPQSNRPLSSPANVTGYNRTNNENAVGQTLQDLGHTFRTKFNPVSTRISTQNNIEMMELIPNTDSIDSTMALQEETVFSSQLTLVEDNKENSRKYKKNAGSKFVNPAVNYNHSASSHQGRGRRSFESMSSTNSELPLLHRAGVSLDDLSNARSSAYGVDNPTYRSHGRLNSSGNSITSSGKNKHSSTFRKLSSDSHFKTKSVENVLGQRAKSQGDILADNSSTAAGGKRICQRQFSDDFVPFTSFDSKLGGRNSLSFVNHLSMNMNDPWLYSFDSFELDSRTPDGACCSQKLFFEPRSISKDDLILEDIEDSEDDFLDESQSELLLNYPSHSQDVLSAANHDVSLGDEEMDCRHASSSAAVDDTNLINTPDSLEMTPLHVREVWKDKVTNSSRGISADSAESGIILTGVTQENRCIERQVMAGATHSKQRVMTREGREPPNRNNTQVKANKKTNLMPEKYIMFILGGAEKESTSFITKPLSMWKIDIKIG